MPFEGTSSFLERGSKEMRKFVFYNIRAKKGEAEHFWSLWENELWLCSYHFILTGPVVSVLITGNTLFEQGWIGAWPSRTPADPFGLNACSCLEPHPWGEARVVEPRGQRVWSQHVQGLCLPVVCAYDNKNDQMNLFFIFLLAGTMCHVVFAEITFWKIFIYF